MIAPFVAPEFLADPPADLALADVRWYLDGRSGREAYLAGHLPGAVFIDLDEALAGPSGPSTGRHPLPDPAVFAGAMTAAGIGPETTVVAYDDAGGVIAARLVFLLRILGVAAAVLDGGIDAVPGPRERGAARPEPVHFPVTPWPSSALATIDEAQDPSVVVLDARDAARYRGEFEPVDPRAGHIPGARNLACRENLDPSGRLLAPAALVERLERVGVLSPDTPVISYCGSGVTACHNLLVLEYTGRGRGRLYPGSWSQYSARADLPIATGPEPGGESPAG